MHRLVANSFIGPCPEGQEVRHLDGDRRNNSVSNIAYGTRSENTYDKIKHGTHLNANKTSCPAGHEYSAENTYVLQRGTWIQRYCRACNRDKKRRYAGRV